MSSTRRRRSTAPRGGRRSCRITLPLLRRSIALSLIISVIGSFLAFNQFFILAQNNVSLETVVEWVYQTAFGSYHLAYGTSMALLLVVVVGLVSIVAVRRAQGHDRAVSGLALGASDRLRTRSQEAQAAGRRFVRLPLCRNRALARLRRAAPLGGRAVVPAAVARKPGRPARGLHALHDRELPRRLRAGAHPART